MNPRLWLKTSGRTRSRYLLRVLSLLACGVFVFVFYFVNSFERVSEPLLQVEYGPRSSPRCVLPIYRAGQSSRYTVLYNFVPGDTPFGYEESITYTTHGTSVFLRHVESIAARWKGPVSLAVYAPASDFVDTLSVVQYLRQCTSPVVRQLTTFHLFFDNDHRPEVLPCSIEEAVPAVDCETFIFPNTSYQAENNLSYPVNVARNVARISAQTRYVLPSDIELYPSANLIPMFLDMMARQSQPPVNVTTTTLGPSSGNTTLKPSPSNSTVLNTTTMRTPTSNGTTSGNATATIPAKKTPETSKPLELKSPVRTVYVLPIFEVDQAYEAPYNKSELVALFASQKVVPFHKYVCPECHRVPKQDDWLKELPKNDTLGVLYTTKRHKPYHNWEPIYIGTNDEPLYDERLNWEGMSDKMTQAYEMCLLDYNFSILDNAFLVHAPGIKRYSKNQNKWRKSYVWQNSKLRKQIKKELGTKYNANSKCSL